MVRLIKNKTSLIVKGVSGEVDKLIVLLVLFMMLAVFMAFVEPFIVRNKVVLLTKEVVEEMEFMGKIDKSFVEDSIKKYDLQGLNPQYKFTGAIAPSGKVQLRDEFTFWIRVDVKLDLVKISPSMSFTIPISKTQTGRSQVYYKPGEI